jgi:hypothetical protein
VSEAGNSGLVAETVLIGSAAVFAFTDPLLERENFLEWKVNSCTPVLDDA